MKVNVKVAGRIYPVKINNLNQEASLIKVTEDIEELMKKTRNTHTETKSVQDLLAMCIIQLVTHINKKEEEENETASKIFEKVSSLNQILEAELTSQKNADIVL